LSGLQRRFGHGDAARRHVGQLASILACFQASRQLAWNGWRHPGQTSRFFSRSSIQITHTESCWWLRFFMNLVLEGVLLLVRFLEGMGFFSWETSSSRWRDMDLRKRRHYHGFVRVLHLSLVDRGLTILSLSEDPAVTRNEGPPGLQSI
jgi:hypothetical protein